MGLLDVKSSLSLILPSQAEDHHGERTGTRFLQLSREGHSETFLSLGIFSSS